MADLYELLGAEREPRNMPYFWSVPDRPGFLKELIEFLNDDKQDQKNISRGEKYGEKPMNINFLKVTRTSLITRNQQLAVLGYPDDRNEKHPIARNYTLIGIWKKEKQKLIPCTKLTCFFRDDEADLIMEKRDDTDLVAALSEARVKIKELADAYVPSSDIDEDEFGLNHIISDAIVDRNSRSRYRRAPDDEFTAFTEEMLSKAYIPDVYEDPKTFVQKITQVFLEDTEKFEKCCRYERLVKKMRDNPPPNILPLKLIRDALPKQILVRRQRNAVAMVICSQSRLYEK